MRLNLWQTGQPVEPGNGARVLDRTAEQFLPLPQSGPRQLKVKAPRLRN